MVTRHSQQLLPTVVTISTLSEPSPLLRDDFISTTKSFDQSKPSLLYGTTSPDDRTARVAPFTPPLNGFGDAPRCAPPWANLGPTTSST